MASKVRDKLVNTAVELFKKHGYHAMGIDRIIAESGVSKMTLYNHFRSKDELILAALRRWDEESRNWLMREIERRTKSPAKRLLVLFDVLDEWFSSNDFYGCMFINATAEFADQNDPIHATAAEHKRLFRGYLYDLCKKANAQNPDDLTDQIVLLMEGAIVTAQVSGRGAVGTQARKAAEVLIKIALGE